MTGDVLFSDDDELAAVAATDPPATRDPLAIFRAADLANRPRPPALVRGLLSAGTLGLIYGAPGALKSFLSIDLALSVAAGRPFFGRDVAQGAVLYVAGEGGAAFLDRLRAWTVHHDEDLARLPFYVLPAAPDLRSQPGDLSAVLSRIADLPPLKLVVVDTLSRVLAGGDENGPTDMGAVVASLDAIRHATGAHVLAIHHSGKDRERGARGHSLLRAALDTEIELTRDPETGAATATVTKQRDLPDGGKLYFCGEPVELGIDDDGDRLSSLVAVPTDAPQHRRQAVSGQAKLCLDLLRRAILDHGTDLSPGPNVPAEVRGVPVSTWREFVRQGLAVDGQTPDAVKKAFQRAMTTLQTRQIIGAWHGMVWIARQGDAGQDRAGGQGTPL